MSLTIVLIVLLCSQSRQLVLVEAFGGFDRRGQHLQMWRRRRAAGNSPSGSTPLAAGARLVFLQEFVDARELQGLGRLPEIVVDDAVELGPSCCLIEAYCSPTRPPPNILALRPISLAERTMPTASGG